MIADANNDAGGAAPSPEGGGGALFTRPDNLRSDARLAARMISLGVVPEEQAEALLKAGFALAAKMAQREDARSFASLMKIPIELARLEQAERHKMLDKVMPDKHEHSHAVTQIQTLLDEFRGHDDPLDGPPLGRALPGPNGRNGHGRQMGEG